LKPSIGPASLSDFHNLSNLVLALIFVLAPILNIRFRSLHYDYEPYRVI
jgi:hypothetical protein